MDESEAAAQDVAADTATDGVQEMTTPEIIDEVAREVGEPVEELLNVYEDWLIGLTYEGYSPTIVRLIYIASVIAVAAAALFIVRPIILMVIRKVVSKTKTKWDDFLVERRFFSRLAHIIPAVVLYILAPRFNNELFGLSGELIQEAIKRMCGAYVILIGVGALGSLADAVSDIYGTLRSARKTPITGFVQGVKLVLWVLGGISVAAVVAGKDVSTFFAGLGALTAVVMLVFKDSILGFVATIQIFVNDVVHVGDWIEVPKFGIDGDVIEITLTTIKVRNFDKTITTIPTHAVMSEAFKNWRGMQEAGGRRIKRAIKIDMNSVRFCDQELLARFRAFSLISEYVDQKAKDVVSFNKRHEIDTSHHINGRQLTNIGTFRAYLKAFLDQHEAIHPKMTFLVRHLPPTETGLPIEVYVFCKDTRWVKFEEIQADIFDHILAVIPEFNLRVFQNPTGSDFRSLSSDSAA